MNKGPTLAQLVRKWHRTYSHKSRWVFSYFPIQGNYADPDLKRGWLEHVTRNCPGVLVENDYAVIGSQIGANPEYANFKIIAADPRFFAKLDRMMQFATNIPTRRDEFMKSFYDSEQALLKEVLK